MWKLKSNVERTYRKCKNTYRKLKMKWVIHALKKFIKWIWGKDFIVVHTWRNTEGTFRCFEGTIFVILAIRSEFNWFSKIDFWGVTWSITPCDHHYQITFLQVSSTASFLHPWDSDTPDICFFTECLILEQNSIFYTFSRIKFVQFT